jgi:hypothetical protein
LFIALHWTIVIGASSAGFLNRAIEGKRLVQVFVRDNNVDQALRALKKKLQREGVLRGMTIVTGA